MSKYMILSFDGDGIRGALSITLLKRLSDKFPNLIESVDLFAGTSTGSFIAFGLAYGKTLSELFELFSYPKARFIFNPTYLNMLRSRYNNKNLIKALNFVFPTDLLLSQLDQRVIILAFRTISSNSGTWRPIFFNNFPESDTKDETVIKVALASSAAPTYFPAYQNHIDGGVIVNNPSTAAISIVNKQKYKPTQVDEICLLSIGTGFNPNKIRVDTEDWGFYSGH